MGHRTRSQRVKYKYNLDDGDFDAIVRMQGGCGICGATESGMGFVVDHDHACCPSSSKKTCGMCVRGILCGRCDSALGYFRDDTSAMAKAIVYLDEYRKRKSSPLA